MIRLHVLFDLLALLVWALAFLATEYAGALAITLLLVVAFLWYVPWIVMTTRPWSGASIPGLSLKQRLYVTVSSVFLLLTWVSGLAAVSMYSSGLFVLFTNE